MPTSPVIHTRLTFGGDNGNYRRTTDDVNNSNNNSNRPVSVHGNLIHNQSIYANVTSPVAAPGRVAAPHNNNNNGGLNLSASAPNASRLNGSIGANLNHSSSNNASPSNGTRTTLMDSSHELNTTQISPIANGRHRRTSSNVRMSNGDLPHNSTAFHNVTGGHKQQLNASLLPANVSRFMSMSKEAGVKEMITSLALLCIVSLLLALLSLFFMLKISPAGSSADDASLLLSREGFVVVYEVTLAMCALALSLNLCCLLVCAIQFLFAVKLVKSAHGKVRYIYMHGYATQCNSLNRVTVDFA